MGLNLTKHKPKCFFLNEMNSMSLVKKHKELESKQFVNAKEEKRKNDLTDK